MTPTPRVTGIGGVFFKARDRARLGDWYRRHLDVDVEDGGGLDPVLAALRGEGVSVDERVEETTERRFGWITDPDGNRIELWQPPPGH